MKGHKLLLLRDDFSMIEPRKQVIILMSLCALIVVVSMPSFAAQTNQERAEAMAGAAGAGGDKVFSVKQIFDAMTHSVSELLPDGDSDSASSKAEELAKSGEKGATSPTKGKDPKESVEPKMIKAKRLDNENPTGDPATAPPAPPPPYKVYASPMIADDPVPVRSAPPVSLEPEIEIDMKAPPPLPQSVKKALDTASDGMVDIELDSKQIKPSAAPKARYKGVPPTSALPKQFFPILPLGGGDDAQAQLLPIASNIELDADHSDTKRAIIFIHDIQRNSAEGVATLMTLSGPEEIPSLILAPQFSLDMDITRFAQHLPEGGRNVARWSLEEPWQYGAETAKRPQQRGISSFTAIDLLLLFLSDKKRFPSLEQVVLVGHGMGADFVQRYAVVGQAPDILEKDRVLTRFVVANPSSYMYLTNLRPSDTGTTFKNPDTKECPKMHTYPYGLTDLVTYAKRTGANAIRIRYPERRILYLVSDSIASDNYLDRGCEAMAQGKDRLQRGRLYGRYLSQSFGELIDASQMFVVVPKAGYDPVSVFGSSCSMAVMFATGTCSAKRPE